MSTVVSDRTRNILFHSLSAVEARKDALADAIAASLSAAAPDGQSPVHSETAAALLVTMLLEQVKHLIEGQPPQDLEMYRAEHRLYAIDRRHYSRFGDALMPVLRDAMGSGFPKSVGSAWVDAFWAIVQRMQQHQESVPA